MRTHVSINVRDVGRSVEFYEKVFGVKPQKQTSTYAKFDLYEPPLNFSMQSEGEVSHINHFGIEVDTPEEVKVWADKLMNVGLLKFIEEDSTCCFARQDKAWFADPDGNEWEIFHVYEQLPITEKKEKSPCCGGKTSCGSKA